MLSTIVGKHAQKDNQGDEQQYILYESRSLLTHLFIFLIFYSH